MFKENFIQNFFEKLTDMKLSSESEALKVFVDDLRFKEIKKKEVRNLQSTVG